jgi:hypothetical protein
MAIDSSSLSEPCELLCRGVLVGLVRQTLLSDNTWYGRIEFRLHEGMGEVRDRMSSFVSFCEDWHDRLNRHPENPPDAAEFEKFGELLQTGSWILRDNEGRNHPIGQAPVFLKGGEISWFFASAGGS